MQRAFTARAGQPGMPAIELLEGFELLEGIQLEGFELLELIEGGIAEGIHRAGRATWYAGD